MSTEEKPKYEVTFLGVGYVGKDKKFRSLSDTEQAFKNLSKRSKSQLETLKQKLSTMTEFDVVATFKPEVTEAIVRYTLNNPALFVEELIERDGNMVRFSIRTNAVLKSRQHGKVEVEYNNTDLHHFTVEK